MLGLRRRGCGGVHEGVARRQCLLRVSLLRMRLGEPSSTARRRYGRPPGEVRACGFHFRPIGGHQRCRAGTLDQRPRRRRYVGLLRCSWLLSRRLMTCAAQPAVAADVTLAYARVHAAERQGR